MTNRFLLVGDVHLADKPVSVRTDTYTEDILTKLEFCVQTANQYNVPLIQGGDMFHIKTSSKNSHRLVQATHEVLKHVNCGVWVVPGNHDLQNDRLDSLDSQPLGSLSRMSNIQILVGSSSDLPGVFGVPYISEFDGGDWETALVEKYSRFGLSSFDSVDLLVTHAPIFPDDKKPGVYASISPAEWSAFWPEASNFFYSHIHDPHGFYQSNGAWFCNNGAISRGSLHEETLKREPAVTLFDSEASGCPFVSIPVPFKPVEQVFRLAEHVEKQEAKERLDDFLGGLNDVQLTSLSLEAVINHAQTTNLSDKAKKELADIVQFVVG